MIRTTILAGFWLVISAGTVQVTPDVVALRRNADLLRVVRVDAYVVDSLDRRLTWAEGTLNWLQQDPRCGVR